MECDEGDEERKRGRGGRNIYFHFAGTIRIGN